MVKSVLQRKGCEGMEWIELTQNRVQCCAFKNRLIDLRFSQKQGIAK
jgi:hypothetical protein